MSTSDSDNDFELLKEQVQAVKATSQNLAMEQKVQMLENRITVAENKILARDTEVQELTDIIEKMKNQTHCAPVDDPKKDQKLVVAEEQNRALSREVEKLKATIKKLEEENSGNPISQEIFGSWRLHSPMEHNLQLKKFPEEKRQRFEMLLKAETANNVAKYGNRNGRVSFFPTLKSGSDFECFGYYKHKTWTNKFVFPDGQKGEVVKTVERDFLNMVLRSNGEEMTIWWKRITPDSPANPTPVAVKQTSSTDPSAADDCIGIIIGLLLVIIFLILAVLIFK